MKYAKLASLIPVICIALISCSAVPIGTMVKMAGFGKEEMLALEAKNIRARLTVNEGIQVKPEKTQLSASFQTKGEQQQLLFPLQIIQRETIAAQQGLFWSRPAFQKITLKLSPEGVSAFRQAQALAQAEQDGKASFSVNASLNKEDGGEISTDEEILLTIELKLGQKEDYFTLIDEWQVKIQ